MVLTSDKALYAYNARLTYHAMKKSTLFRMLTDESGQGLVEYALVSAMISTVIIGGLHIVGQKINSLLIAAGNEFP